MSNKGKAISDAMNSMTEEAKQQKIQRYRETRRRNREAIQRKEKNKPSDKIGPEEKMIFEMCHDWFPDAISQYKLRDLIGGKSRESIDIMIPSIRVAVEYHGERFHIGKEDYDAAKYRKVEEKGYNVIVYQEYLPSIIELLLDIQQCQSCNISITKKLTKASKIKDY